MTTNLTLKALRTLAYYHSDAGLQQRLAHTEDIVRRQREGLAWAVAEIERLTAELEAARAVTPPCTVDADGHDSGTTRAPQE